MAERHPFGIFVPPNPQYLLLGSFPSRPSPSPSKTNYDWFFSNARSQFWPILESVYGLPLQNKDQKQALFATLGIAITDIVLECERNAESSLDVHLVNMHFNTNAISKVLNNNNIISIFFSSRFAERLYHQHFKEVITKFPNINLITLPSPSPRYAAMSKTQKIALYKKLLPKLHFMLNGREYKDLEAEL